MIQSLHQFVYRKPNRKARDFKPRFNQTRQARRERRALIQSLSAGRREESNNYVERNVQNETIVRS